MGLWNVIPASSVTLASPRYAQSPRCALCSSLPPSVPLPPFLLLHRPPPPLVSLSQGTLTLRCLRRAILVIVMEQGTGRIVPFVNRTFEWGVVTATVLSVWGREQPVPMPIQDPVVDGRHVTQGGGGEQ